MDSLVSQNTSEDNVKRLKLLLLAASVAISMFFVKVFNTGISLTSIYTTGLVLAGVTFLGLLWAFNFKVKLRSFFYILQGSLFVFSEVVFVLIFFIQDFSRLYESILLILLLIFIWLTTYVCFLMVNVFNVSIFKPLPLIQVSQTASYILSLLMVYFFTFSLLASSLPIYILFPLILGVYFFIVYIQFLELSTPKDFLWRRVVLIVSIMFSLLTPFIFVSSNHEFVAIVPTVGLFVGGGLLNINKEGFSKKFSIVGYNVLLLVIVILTVYLSWF